MERIKSLNRYQKVILLLMITMVMVFAVVYFIIIARKGFAYKNVILIPNQENGNTVYSGKIQGKLASFTVYADNAVEFQYGDKIYGPYTAKEDPTAIPKDSMMADQMIGVELLHGEEIIFRGGMWKNGNHYWLYNEDGSVKDLSIVITTSNGIVTDENGNVIDPMEPSASTILELMDDPELTHKGTWAIWFGGVLVCIVTGISILFADELFRWHLIFHVQNVEDVEPSDWEIVGRYIGWTVVPIMAFILFIIGLR